MTDDSTHHETVGPLQDSTFDWTITAGDTVADGSVTHA